MAFKVLITDPIDPICTELLAAAGLQAETHLKVSPETLRDLVPHFEGWIIRSGTQITADLLQAATRLNVIGRAGVGVDNVDLAAATRRGVLVMNAPDGNTLSTAEHACAMLLSLARNIPQANTSLRGGAWERKAFTGAELYGKTLGIVGVGKIGRTVAERMKHFGMDLLGFDPVVSTERAETYGVTLVSLDRLFAESDFLTFHTPLNDHTRDMLNATTLKQCKKGVRIVNCARGGIVDETALLAALEAGHVAGAALDVFSQEPPGKTLQTLLAHPRVVTTPHIAASTTEAQAKVARQITEQVIEALYQRPVKSPVNAVAIKLAAQREIQPYLQLAEKMGQCISQLTDGPLDRITVSCHGDLLRRYAEILSIAALRGILSRWTTEPVNYVNAETLAKDLGLHLEEQRHTAEGNYKNFLKITLGGPNGERTVAGVVVGEKSPRIVRIDDYDVEVRPEGTLLIYTNADRPGMLAAVGGILAQADINIAGAMLGREAPGTVALTIISVDGAIPPAVRAHIADMKGVSDVRVVSIETTE